MTIRLLCAGACVFLLAGSAAAKPAVATTTVNLRAEANITSQVLAKIPGSGRLDVGDCKEGWCAVTYRGKNGFVTETAIDATSGALARQSARRSIPGVPRYGAGDDDFIPLPRYRGPYGPPPPPVVYPPGPYYGPGFAYYGPPAGFGFYGPHGHYGWRRW